MASFIRCSIFAKIRRHCLHLQFSTLLNTQHNSKAHNRNHLWASLSSSSSSRYLSSSSSPSSTILPGSDATTENGFYKEIEENERDRDCERSRRDCISLFLSHMSAAWGVVDSSTNISLLLATSSSVTDPSSQALANTELNSVLLPALGVLSLAGGTGWVLRRYHRSKRNKETNEAESKKAGNKATELYDDLYVGRTTQYREFAEYIFEQYGSPSGTKKRDVNRMYKGVPAEEFITLRHLNQRIDSYQYSMTAAVHLRAKAVAQIRELNFDRALRKALQSNRTICQKAATTESCAMQSQDSRSKLFQIEQEFLEAGANMLMEIQQIQTKLTQNAVEDEIKKMGIEMSNLAMPTSLEGANEDTKAIDDDSKENGANQISPSETKNSGGKDARGDNPKELLQELSEAQKKLMILELAFIKNVVSVVGPQHATGIRVALLGDIAARGSGGLLKQLRVRPLTALFGVPNQPSTTDGNQDGALSDSILITDKEEGDNDINIKSDVNPDDGVPITRQQSGTLFVARFDGFGNSSQMSNFRNQVTAIVMTARKGEDEVVLILTSPGGSTTATGLAAGQLQRLKESGLKVTVVVEQIATGGGYMICCLADRIIGSPFAVFGNIKAVTELPNFHRRLKEEGVEFYTSTAGKYKRTLTPFKEVAEEDKEKVKDQLETLLKIYKRFIQANRPQLAANMDDTIATGKIWCGTDAIDMGLCDEIKTVDDVLTEYIDAGWEVYEVSSKKSRLTTIGLPALGHADVVKEDDTKDDGILTRAARWFIRLVLLEAKSEILKEAERFDPMKNYGEKAANNYAMRYEEGSRFRA